MGRTAADAPAVKPEKKNPKYDIVKVHRDRADNVAEVEAEKGAPLRPGDTLTIIAVGKEGKTALDAADEVVNSLPKEERGGEFAGFLSGSYKQDVWETEERVITSRKSQK